MDKLEKQFDSFKEYRKVLDTLFVESEKSNLDSQKKIDDIFKLIKQFQTKVKAMNKEISNCKSNFK